MIKIIIPAIRTMMKSETKSTNVVAAVVLVLLVQHIQLTKNLNHGISSHLITIGFKIRSSRIGLTLILNTGSSSDARYVTLYSLSNINKSSPLAHKMTQKHAKNFELRKHTRNIKTFFITLKAHSFKRTSGQ